MGLVLIFVLYLQHFLKSFGVVFRFLSGHALLHSSIYLKTVCLPQQTCILIIHITTLLSKILIFYDFSSSCKSKIKFIFSVISFYRLEETAIYDYSSVSIVSKKEILRKSHCPHHAYFIHKELSTEILTQKSPSC